MTPAAGMNSTAWRLPSVMVPVLSSSSTSTSPAASTARPDRASTLRCTSRSMPAMPMHESRAPMVVGISATSRPISTVLETPLLRVERERLQRRPRRPGRSGSGPAIRMLRAISFGVLRRSAPSTSAIMRSRKLARLLGDAHHEPVGQQPRAAGDRAAVAARLADDRSRLAGDRRLVHRADALDHVAVARDQVAGLARRRGRRAGARARAPAPASPSSPPAVGHAWSLRVARSASAWALPRPSAIASARFAKSTVSHSQMAMTPVNHSGWPPPLTRSIRNVAGGDHRADLDHEHDRVADLDPWVELLERVDGRARRRCPRVNSFGRLPVPSVHPSPGRG